MRRADRCEIRRTREMKDIFELIKTSRKNNVCLRYVKQIQSLLIQLKQITFCLVKEMLFECLHCIVDNYESAKDSASQSYIIQL